MGGVDEDEGIAHAEGDAGQDRVDPVRVRGRTGGLSCGRCCYRCPREPEFTHGAENGPEADGNDGDLGRDSACAGVPRVTGDNAADDSLRTARTTPVRIPQ